MNKIDGYPIDATISEQHNRKSRVTSHPIERKSNSNDHVIIDPPDVVMECVISNAPFGKIETLRVLEDGRPSENAFARFDALWSTGKVVTIETSLKTYTDMVCVNLSYPVKVETGDSLRVTATFQNMNFIDHERVFVPVAAPVASKRDVRGNKPGKKPPDAPANAKADRLTSVAWDLTH